MKSSRLLFIAALIGFAGAGATDFVQLSSAGGSPIRCYVDGVEQDGTHNQPHTRDERLTNLVLSNPDAEEVRCDQTLSIIGRLTAAGRALLSDAEAAVVVTATPGSSSLAPASWAERSTGPNVTMATDFSTANDFVRTTTNGGHVFYNEAGEIGNVVQDTENWLSGGSSLKIVTPTSEGQNGAAWVGPLNDAWTSHTQSFPLGTDIYIQFRLYVPASRLVSTLGSQAGWKIMNVAHYDQNNTDSNSPSNTRAEHVLQDTFEAGYLQAYRRIDGGGSNFPPFQEFGIDPENPSNWSNQNAVDLGPPLTGGDRWCLGTDGTPACQFWNTDEWLTIDARIRINTYSGSAGNKFDLWYTRAGSTTRNHLISFSDYEVGDPNSESTGHTGLNGVHLLNYSTGRTGGTVDTHVRYDQLIVSTSEIPLPNDDGTNQASSSVIAQQAAGMSSGEWAQVTPTPSGLDLFTGGNTSGIITYFAGQMHINPVDNEIHWTGSDHATRTLFLTYDYDTNTWAEEAQVPWGVGQGGDTSHGYDHGAFDTTRNVYYNAGEFAAQEIRRWNGGSSWTTFGLSALNTNAAVTYAMEYFPERDEVLVLFQENGTVGQLVAFDPSTDNASILINQSSNTIDSTSGTHMSMVYNPVSGIVVFGGGNNTTATYKMDSAGTVTRLTDAPVGYGVAGHGRLWPNPANGEFILIQDDTTWYDLDASGSGTWTARAGSVEMLETNVTGGTGAPDVNSVIGVADRVNDVLIFVKGYSPSADAEMWLLKLEPE